MLIKFKGFLSDTSRAWFGFIFLLFDSFVSPYSVNASTGMDAKIESFFTKFKISVENGIPLVIITKKDTYQERHVRLLKCSVHS